MKVDIIVPVFNQAAYVKVMLTSLLRSYNATPAEIIVIDDKSSELATLKFLDVHAESGAITLLRNEANLGFTRTVNRGMALHGDRDVVLLNSDTKVYGNWLDRMVACAYAAPKIATVNPMTGQFGSHIGCYPELKPRSGGELEVTGEELSAICAEVNTGRVAEVHTTVGFCMYIRRAALDEVGLFDAKHFPVGYGEETDFCCRSWKVGWQHRIAGDAYVDHFEGKSFGARKQKLIKDMATVFSRLHPDLTERDRKFELCDPVRPLRRQIDLGRLKRLLGGSTQIEATTTAGKPRNAAAVLFDFHKSTARFITSLPTNILPNIGEFRLPRDMIAFNRALASLGVDEIVFGDAETLEAFNVRVVGQSFETALAAARRLADEPALAVA